MTEAQKGFGQDRAAWRRAAAIVEALILGAGERCESCA